MITLDWISYDLPDREQGASTVHKDKNNVIFPLTSDVQVRRLGLLWRVTVNIGFTSCVG